MKIKFDAELMNVMSMFSKATRVDPKDAIKTDNGILFIVPEGTIGRAVGKQGVNAKKMEKILNRKIKIVEFNPDIKSFGANLILPLKVKEIAIDKSMLILSGEDFKTKSLLIGRDGKNLRQLENVVNRYFEVEQIKVV